MHLNRKLFTFLTAFALLALAAAPALACTGITVKARDGAVIHARTLEFAQDLHSHVLMIPRGYALVSPGPGGKPGLTWKAKYAALGMNFLGETNLADGMNEKGLAAGLFYLPSFAKYQEVSPGDQDKCLAPWDVPVWLLTNFAGVDEVRAALPKVTVWPGILPELGKTPVPLHFIVTDKSGKSLVIEYVGGRLNIYDNPLGVITNSPTFDWHLTNLRNYVNLSANNVAPVKLQGISLYPTGEGSGMLGLPGDITPPSRFIRAVAFTQAALPMANGHDAAGQAFRLLDSFYITRGMSRAIEDGKPSYDHTQWMDACDLKNLKFYFATYENLVPKMVDFKKLDMEGDKLLRIPISGGPFYMDVTGFAK